MNSGPPGGEFEVLISRSRYLFLLEQEIAKLFFNLILLTFLLTLISSIFSSTLTAFLRSRNFTIFELLTAKVRLFAYVTYILRAIS